MAQLGKVPVTKPNGLRSVPEVMWLKEGTDSCKLSSVDGAWPLSLHTHTVTYAHRNIKM